MEEVSPRKVFQSRENQNVIQDVKSMAKQLVAEAKTCASEGELYKSLKLFKKAYKLVPSDKIQSRIARIEEAIAAESDEDDDENFGFVELDNGIVIYKKIIERLYPHQIEGVKWLYNLYDHKMKGGILADDMGLGKTIQVIAFLSAMFDMKLIKHILLVLPLSVIPNWQNEFANWAPGIKVEHYHGPISKRKAILQQCMRRRSVCITTYGLIVTQWQSLSETLDGREYVWDYIILDEGHRIKNASKTTKGLHKIPSKNRIILTGTPVQNKVRDMWALIDWVTQGSLLGTQRTFKSSYELPIERARQKDASPSEIHLGNMMAESLRKLTDPHILRRTKGGLSANLDDKENQCVDNAQDPTVLGEQPSFPKLSTKNDFVVWVYLSEIQQEIYRDFIQLDSVKELLSSHKSPLVYLTILKKICDHPRLLSTKACHELGLESNDSRTEDLDTEAIEGCAANRINNIPDTLLMEESGKLQFLIQLLIRLREEGHRTLVFSMSRKMLNIMQRILMNLRFKLMRLDGLVTKLSEREKRVKLFQEDPSYDVFLLTTQVGGVGLTLTAADRVVIYDPSWNPATDAQAVDRIYRIGQKKSVVVYRLITCGSVEEKIYRRQIFKNSVIQQSTGESKDPYRYFSRQELAELFTLDDVLTSSTQIQLDKLHGHQRKLDAELQKHVDHLHTMKMFGLSDHDLMFSQKPDDFECDEEAITGLSNKVQEAQNKLQMESNQFTGKEETEQRWGRFTDDRFSDPKTFKDIEPVFPIEGISMKLENLQIPSPPKNTDMKPIKFEPKEEDDIVYVDSPLPTLFKPKVRKVEALSYNDNDDDVILCCDSPNISAQSKSEQQTELPDLPNEIEDSFEMFGDLDSDTDEHSSDDEWKIAFTAPKSNVVDISEDAAEGEIQPPLKSTTIAGSTTRRSEIFAPTPEAPLETSPSGSRFCQKDDSGTDIDENEIDASWNVMEFNRSSEFPQSPTAVHDISPSITRMAENLKLSGNNITTNSTTNIEVVNDSDAEDFHASASDSNENAHSVVTSFDDITAPIDEVITAAKVVNDSNNEDFQVSSSNSCENVYDVTKSVNDITAKSDEVTSKDEGVDDLSNNVTSLPETSKTETWPKSVSATAKDSDFDFKLSVSDEEDDFNDLASNDSSNEIPIFEVHDHDDYE